MLLLFVVLGLIAGSVTGKIIEGARYGALLDLALGIIGVLIGSYVWWLIVALIVGSATRRAVKGLGYGSLLDIGLGIVGAVIGGSVMSALGFAAQGGTIYTIIVATVGACTGVAVVRSIRKRPPAAD